MKNLVLFSFLLLGVAILDAKKVKQQTHFDPQHPELNAPKEPKLKNFHDKLNFELCNQECKRKRDEGAHQKYSEYLQGEIKAAEERRKEGQQQQSHLHPEHPDMQGHEHHAQQKPLGQKHFRDNLSFEQCKAECKRVRDEGAFKSYQEYLTNKQKLEEEQARQHQQAQEEQQAQQAQHNPNPKETL